jgi:uncharacterized damage-inducible protein DinB
MIEYFKKLFQYNRWVNNHVLQTLGEMPGPDREIVKLFSHILAAQRIWLRRLSNQEYKSMSGWPDKTFAECKELSRASDTEWVAFLDELVEGELDKRFEFTDTEGIACAIKYRDALTHVVNHGSHHRAQIASLMRKAGMTPPRMDFAVFAREEL